jgi:hypothetical protein
LISSAAAASKASSSDREDQLGGGGCELGEAAEGDDRRDPRARRGTFATGVIRDHAGNLEPRRERQLGLDLVFAARQQQVDEADAG